MNHFDIDRAIAEAGLPTELTDDIMREAREDYPDDQMLYELRVIRGIKSALYEKLGPDAYLKRMKQEVQEFREEQGLELVSEPLEIVQRLRRKSQAS